MKENNYCNDDCSCNNKNCCLNECSTDINCYHKDKTRNCNKILESIALEEAQIAHILNAEGDKLQKAIEITSDVKCLMEVNDSVVKTIIHITHLEQILYGKLEQVLNEFKCSCPCKDCDCYNPYQNKCST